MRDDLIAPTRCACSWATDDTPEPPCGCGQHTVRLYRDEVWYWRDHHWTSTCLIAALTAQGETARKGTRAQALADARQGIENAADKRPSLMNPDTMRHIAANLEAWADHAKFLREPAAQGETAHTDVPSDAELAEARAQKPLMDALFVETADQRAGRIAAARVASALYRPPAAPGDEQDDPICGCGHPDSEHWRDDEEEGGSPCHATGCGCGEFDPPDDDPPAAAASLPAAEGLALRRIADILGNLDAEFSARIDAAYEVAVTALRAVAEGRR